MLVIDRSQSIGDRNWLQMVFYMETRVDATAFTGRNGNRIGIVSFSTDVILCPLTHVPEVLKKCILNIQYLGGRTNAADAIAMVGLELDKASRFRFLRVGMRSSEFLSLPAPVHPGVLFRER